jgi:hypothetical protein
VRAVRVAEVDDLQPVEDLEPQIQVIGARFVGSGTDGAGAETRAGPVGRPYVERCTDDRDIRPPRVQLFDLGEKRPLPERHHPRVGELELLGHARRKVALTIVVVTHWSTVPSPAFGVGPVRASIGRVRGLTLNRSERFAQCRR